MIKGKTRNGGQALVLFLGFAAAMVGMMLIAFNSGQVTNAKMRAMNAADAAAYSGAVWQARTLNFQAYMNRAMIVNEVTIAQSVSLRSWVAYLDRMVTNINTVAQFVPYLGQATRAIQRGLRSVDTAMQSALPPMEMMLRSVNVAAHGAQVAIDLPAIAIAHELADKVATANGANMSAGIALGALNETEWLALTQTYSKGPGGNRDGRVRLRDVTLNSRDGFVEARDWDVGGPLVQNELRKQGGTNLIDYDTWKGLDSMEYRTIYNPFKGWVTRIPIGWGGAQAYPSRSLNRNHGRHGRVNEWNDADGRNARNDANSSGQAKSVGAAFPGYRDISEKFTKVKNADLRVPFTVEVMIKAADIASQMSVTGGAVALQDGTRLDHTPGYFGDKGVYAMSEACVTFERPLGAARNDGATEFPSLFNPYWRASLATESWKSRSAADFAKGLPSLAAIFSGSGSCSNKNK